MREMMSLWSLPTTLGRRQVDPPSPLTCCLAFELGKGQQSFLALAAMSLSLLSLWFLGVIMAMRWSLRAGCVAAGGGDDVMDELMDEFDDVMG